MGRKLKDYYNSAYINLLADKLAVHLKIFDAAGFSCFTKKGVAGKGLLQRQDVFVEAFEKYLPNNYAQNLKLFTKILGPTLPTEQGMYNLGWWLWPMGRYVEKHGAQNIAASLDFIYELTQRFTGEFAIKPLLEANPKLVMKTMLRWSKDPNVHVRRLASEGLRTRLPWAKKTLAALEHPEVYLKILENLKSDSSRFVQKSIGNNLNDLYKDRPDLAEKIVKSWQKTGAEKETLWIIKHGQRNQKTTRGR